jgi:hypothetical protein
MVSPYLIESIGFFLTPVLVLTNIIRLGVNNVFTGSRKILPVKNCRPVSNALAE